MILVNLLLIAAVGAAASLSTRFFSPVELQDRFEEGQKLYALGDYDKAIERYEVILSTESNAMINVEDVTVAVDEFILPVRVGATYQLGNTYNKLGLEKLQRSQFLRSEKKEAEADARYEEALQDLNKSRDHFRTLAADESVDERTRVMAQYQMIQTSYQLKEYEQDDRRPAEAADGPGEVTGTARDGRCPLGTATLHSGRLLSTRDGRGPTGILTPADRPDRPGRLTAAGTRSTGCLPPGCRSSAPGPGR